MEALRDIPATLEETYEQALTEIPEKDTERARSILLWLVFSLRPLTLEEVAAVVKLPRSSDVLRICTSKLVTLSQQDLEICNCTTSCKVVQLAHSSVREYLVSDKLKTSENKKASSFFVSMDLAHVKIGEACLSYLLEMTQADLSSHTLQENLYFNTQQSTGFNMQK